MGTKFSLGCGGLTVRHPADKTGQSPGKLKISYLLFNPTQPPLLLEDTQGQDLSAYVPRVHKPLFSSHSYLDHQCQTPDTL